MVGLRPPTGRAVSTSFGSVPEGWQAFSSPIAASSRPGYVQGMATLDFGDGPQLFVAMLSLETPADVPDTLVRWDGSEWTTLGLATTAGEPGTIIGLDALDDGTGPALYVSGRFDVIAGVPVNGIARFDGRTWTDLGTDPRITLGREPGDFS